jgi:hypothetical protein
MAMGIGCLLTTKLIRLDTFEKFIGDEVHREAFTALKGTEVSNRHFSDVRTHKYDGDFRFTIGGWTVCLLKPFCLQGWFSQGPTSGEEDCRKSGVAGRSTSDLSDPVSRCRLNDHLMRERHHRVVKVAKEPLLMFSHAFLKSDVDGNTIISQEGLAGDESSQTGHGVRKRREKGTRRGNSGILVAVRMII